VDAGQRQGLAMPAREKGDWSIASPGRCGCRLCSTLGRFLTASNQMQLEWPLAKEQRAHIHRILTLMICR
jgi:hypothetical protein